MIYIALVILFATLVIGVPVPMCFMSSAAWLLFFGGNAMQGYSTTMLLPYGFSQMNSIVLLAIALFIIAGGIMEKGRIGEKLIDVVDVFVGRIRAGSASSRPSRAPFSEPSPDRAARRSRASARSCSPDSTRPGIREGIRRRSWPIQRSSEC